MAQINTLQGIQAFEQQGYTLEFFTSGGKDLFSVYLGADLVASHLEVTLLSDFYLLVHFLCNYAKQLGFDEGINHKQL